MFEDTINVDKNNAKNSIRIQANETKKKDLRCIRGAKILFCKLQKLL